MFHSRFIFCIGILVFYAFAAHAQYAPFAFIKPSASGLCDTGNINTTCTILTNKSLPNNSVQVIPGNLVIGDGVTAVTLSGNQGERGTLTVTGDFTVKTNAALDGNFTVTAANIVVEASAFIRSNGKGSLGGKATNAAGTGTGFGGGSSTSGGGAGHGGAGSPGQGAAGGTHGSPTSPTTFGSGGGAGDTSDGGDGGGAIKLFAATAITITGTISANGTNGVGGSTYSGGGGSGGSIWINAPSVLGSGSISAVGANGGNGTGDGGNGGGGRISVEVTSTGYSGALIYTVAGSTSANDRRPGDEGTFNLDLSTMDSLCDAGDFTSGCTISSNKIIPRDVSLSGSALTISGGVTVTTIGQGTATFNFTGDLDVSGTWTGDLASLTADDVTVSGTMNSNILASTLNTINVSGSINVSGRGSLGGKSDSGNGSGTGFGGGHGTGGGGAGYGGAGSTGMGAGDAGITYGSNTLPADLGSGGGSGANGDGGNGGGAVKLFAATSITIGGTINANGVNGGNSGLYSGGGGSGGSVWLQSPSVTGAGTISANGGNGYNSTADGGNGGGGRIAIYYQGTSFTGGGGTLTVTGGSGNSRAAGGAGTTYETTY